MKRRMGLVAAGLLALSCASAISIQDGSGGGTGTPAFVVRASSMNAGVADLSRMATLQGFEGRVRTFAQRELMDHSQMDRELQSLARRKGWRLSRGADAEHRVLAGELMRLAREDFDATYMRAMLSDHVEAVSNFRRYVRTGDDPELNAWARRTLTILEAHEHDAEMTNEWVRPAAN